MRNEKARQNLYDKNIKGTTTHEHLQNSSIYNQYINLGNIYNNTFLNICRRIEGNADLTYWKIFGDTR